MVVFVTYHEMRLEKTTDATYRSQSEGPPQGAVEIVTSEVVDAGDSDTEVVIWYKMVEEY